MLRGKELREAIKAMQVSENQFAKLCGFSYTTLTNLFADKTIKPKPFVVEAVERVLSQRCPHCGQHWPEGSIDADIEAKRKGRAKGTT